jgi:hypothetical protein|tara:strand:- start:2751 stop:2873 length:123 start_codon:yes stop_codon:yes gene_type:complete
MNNITIALNELGLLKELRGECKKKDLKAQFEKLKQMEEIK